MAKKSQKLKKSNESAIKEQIASVKNELIDGVFIFKGPMSISDFSKSTGLNANNIISNYFKQGLMLNLNSILTEEQIAELCFENDYDFQKKFELNESNFMDHIIIEDDEKDLIPRPPIITIMGHIDHGKTTLIDYIRKSKITNTEKGGITQHTGAYQIKYNESFITFLDTPGHEAFSEMRSRGAKLTDIVVLIVAADDGVNQQTIESIDHAKAAKVPIIVFVNKMDKEGANPDNVKNQLSKYEILSEDWGGNNQFIYGSGLTGEGVDTLLQAILVEAEILDLKANPNRNGIGVVIESKMDKGQGATITIILENGTLNKRDFIVAGSNYGKIRTIKDTNGDNVEDALPGMPVIITGVNYAPKAGEKLICFEDEKFAKELANKKKFIDKINDISEINSNSNEIENLKNINVIIKADVQGTIDAIKYSILKLQNEELSISIIRSAVGVVSKSDILLAKTTSSIIYTFNINVDNSILNEAKEAKIEIISKGIIYEIVDDIQTRIKKEIGPKYEEIISGKALIQKIFFYSKVGNIAGCLTTDGYVKANSKVIIYRKDKSIFEGKIDSLQHGKNNIKEAKKGKEFGTHIKGFDEFQVDDVIEFYDKILIEN